MKIGFGKREQPATPVGQHGATTAAAREHHAATGQHSAEAAAVGRPTHDRVTSDAVVLRRPTEADRAKFIAAMRASVSYHYPWMLGWTTDAAYDAYLKRGQDERQDLSILFRAEDDAVLGFFNIGEIVRGVFNSAYLGYGGVAGHGGQGYMTAGMQLLLKRAFDDLDLHRLEANIQPDNGPSKALAERCGFVKEGFSEAYLKINGRWRDHERWAIRAEQWRALSPGS